MLMTYLSDRLDREPDLPQVLILILRGREVANSSGSYPEDRGFKSHLPQPGRLPTEITIN